MRRDYYLVGIPSITSPVHASTHNDSLSRSSYYLLVSPTKTLSSFATLHPHPFMWSFGMVIQYYHHQGFPSQSNGTSLLLSYWDFCVTQYQSLMEQDSHHWQMEGVMKVVRH